MILMQSDGSLNAVVGHNVANLRGEMSQAELARRLAQALGKQKMDPSSITRLESGKRPTTVNELAALATILGVTPQVLLQRNESDDVVRAMKLRTEFGQLLDVEMEIRELVNERRRLCESVASDVAGTAAHQLIEIRELDTMRNQASRSLHQFLEDERMLP